MDAHTDFKTLVFLMEAGKRMELHRECVLSAAMLFHRFQQKIKLENFYQQNIIAATSLLIASKTFEKEANITVLATVYYDLLYQRDVDIINPDEKFTELIKFIKDMELYVLRLLKFDVIQESPLRHLLCLLSSVMQLFPPDFRNTYPLERTCFAIMNDAHLIDACVKYEPQHLAIGVIFVSFLSYAVVFPGFSNPLIWEWTKLLSDTLTDEILWSIVDDICDIYMVKDKQRKNNKEEKNSQDDA